MRSAFSFCLASKNLNNKSYRRFWNVHCENLVRATQRIQKLSPEKWGPKRLDVHSNICIYSMQRPDLVPILQHITLCALPRQDPDKPNLTSFWETPTRMWQFTCRLHDKPTWQIMALPGWRTWQAGVTYHQQRATNGSFISYGRRFHGHLKPKVDNGWIRWEKQKKEAWNNETRANGWVPEVDLQRVDTSIVSLI